MGRRKRNKGPSRPRFRVTNSPRDRAGDRPSQASSPREDGVPPAPSPTPSIGEAAWFAPVLTAAYALVLAFALFHHELWRDELRNGIAGFTTRSHGADVPARRVRR